jgi:beta-galactosidase
MILGTPYYPEHWPEERWETDARLMQQAGITRVRMGEFAWHRMEPVEGQFHFDWLRRAIDLYAGYGIETILCTPTPTYPAWLHAKFPDIHQVKSDGTVKEYGQRQDACKNHPGYRRYARRICGEMLQALGDHLHVVAWQTDNEFGCHGTARCHCAHCERAFQDWLRARFAGDVGALNAAWGTFFWSQDYNDFSEIAPPRDTADRTANDGQNPGLVLAFYRFSSDVQVAFHHEQAELIRRHSPGRAITHNLMGLFPQIDYYRLAADLDVVSWDNYPFFQTHGSRRPPPPLAHDLMRGLKRKPVWVMEQASGAGGWGTYPATPPPGQMRLWAYQAVARGADMISFFRWRTCRYGREQYWHGILYHHGLPQRRYEEVVQIGHEFAALSPELDGSEVESPIAILYEYDSLWALESQPNVEGGFGYAAMAGRFDLALSRMGVNADVVGAGSDWGGYKVIIAPCLHVLTPALAERLKSFVRGGGTLILGPRSGVKDEENAIVNELLPGLLRELAGCHVEEYDAFSDVHGLEMHVRTHEGQSYRAYDLADVLMPESEVRVLLSYADRYYAGRPAAIENRYGQGRCIYLGTVLDETGITYLLQAQVGPVAEIPYLEGLPESVEVSRRVKGEQSYMFYLNHSPEAVRVDVAAPGVDLLSGEEVGRSVEIEGYGVVIVKRAPTLRGA